MTPREIASFCETRLSPPAVPASLAGDASTRCYYRLTRKGAAAGDGPLGVLMDLGHPFDPAQEPFFRSRDLLAALGLPGLSGFISEALSLLGAFQTFRTLTIVAAITIVLTAAYMLWVIQRVYLGTLPEKWRHLTDMNGREMAMLVPLAIIVIFLGIYPSPMINLMNSSLNELSSLLQSAGRATMMGAN